MTRVYLSLGSNIDRERNIVSALSELRQRFGKIEVSTIYQCPAEGFAGDDFYNLVVGLDTSLDIEELRKALRDMESGHGRARSSEKFVSRSLDIDLLLFGDQVVDRPGLRIPRDEIVRYAFVLCPLAELAPHLRHPQSGRRMADLWRDFDGLRELSPVTLNRPMGATDGRHTKP